jgi:hypothetical protein
MILMIENLPHVRVGGFFGVTFGRQTLFQIEDILKKLDLRS